MGSSHTLINITHFKNTFIYAQECVHLKLKYTAEYFQPT